MLLFDLIDALEREGQPDGSAPASPPPGGLRPGWPALPFPPAGSMLMATTPPIMPWPPGMQPPFDGSPMPRPPVPTARGPVPALIDLLYRNGPPMMPRTGALPWPAIPMSAAAPTLAEPTGPFSRSQPISGVVEEPAPTAETPTNEDMPSQSDEPLPQIAQAPKQQPNPDVPYPPPARPWLRRRPDEPYPPPSPDVARTIGPKVVAIPQEDGSFEIRQGGTKTWRNNNPGALKYVKDQTARDDGALGVDDDGFAIFPSYEVGKAAALASLRKKTGTLDKAIEAWAPKKENDTAAYQRFVQSQTGLSGDTKIGSLTPQQTEKLYEAIKRYEGWKAGHTKHGRLDVP